MTEWDLGTRLGFGSTQDPGWWFIICLTLAGRHYPNLFPWPVSLKIKRSSFSDHSTAARSKESILWKFCFASKVKDTRLPARREEKKGDPGNEVEHHPTNLWTIWAWVKIQCFLHLILYFWNPRFIKSWFLLTPFPKDNDGILNRTNIGEIKNIEFSVLARATSK